jgi:hypothetical protein
VFRVFSLIDEVFSLRIPIPSFTVNPAFFFGLQRIKGGERLGKTPETLVAASAVFNEESFQRFASSCPEQNHALVDAV